MSTLAPRPTSGKLRSVGFVRTQIRAHEKRLAKSYDGLNIITHGYLVYVSSHVLFLDTNGDTIVDTAPRKRDHRKVRAVFVVYGDRSMS